jgi:hypothetical protein
MSTNEWLWSRFTLKTILPSDKEPTTKEQETTAKYMLLTLSLYRMLTF